MAYPQSNEQVKVVNRDIVLGLKVKFYHVEGNWANELPNILWSYCMTPKISARATLFILVYESEAMIPIKIGMEIIRLSAYDDSNVEQ